MSNYPRGSEWRRWDLHIHTPDTALNDRYANWDEFVTVLAACSDVDVIGVTDYLDISNYLKVRELHSAGKLPHISLVVPNIEFRVLPATNTNPGANVHVLIDPSAVDHAQRIRQALTHLTFGYDGNDYACTADQLIALGRAVHGATLDPSAALVKGIEQFRPDVERFTKWWQGQRWLKENSLVGVVAGGDGLSGWPMGGGLQATREELSRLGHFIFSGREGEIDFWILKKLGMDVDFAKKLGAPKPCLHGSDAHSIEKLFKPDLDRFCWIKGDPTFAGLRQVLYEPELRTYVGPAPPIPFDEGRIIDSISIVDSNGWFANDEIKLNSGLVGIIGPKGSGKSALAELCALAAFAWAGDKPSFLTRAGEALHGLKVTLKWLDGRSSGTTVSDNQELGFPEVKYLSQSFVEHLCSGEDSSSRDLVNEIESVVFDNLDESDRLGYGSFSQLRAAKTEVHLEAQGQLRRQIEAFSAESEQLRTKKAGLPELENKCKAAKTEVESIRKQLPQAAAGKAAAAMVALQKVQADLASVQAIDARDKQTLAGLEGARGRVQAFAREMAGFWREIKTQLVSLGISDLHTANFQPVFRGDTEGPITAREAQLRSEISARQGANVDPKAGTATFLQQEIARLQKELADDKAQRDKLMRQTSRIAELTKNIGRFEKEIADINGPQRERQTEIRAERLKAYQELWGAIAAERAALQALYSPISQEATSGLEFSVDIAVDVDGWIDRGLNLFDQRRAVPFGSASELRRLCSLKWKPAWQSGDPERTKTVVDDLLAQLREMAQSGAYAVRSGYSNTDVFSWVFDTTHIRLDYGLKHNGVELRKLSPGTKGIVLLMVYLGLDRSDSMPLIVDQPEENLDNESIYDSLVKYFREAKSRRQVILITHNPNLIVNTDADQVIVARNERQDDGRPLISYTSGSLEYSEPPDKGIREQVCKILEGGEEAFQKRERRYFLKH